MRPNQWAKNLLVLVAPLISGEMRTWNDSEVVLLTRIILAFTLVSIVVYVFNDIMDLDDDASHPHKKIRPLASGDLSKPTAIAIAVSALLICAAIAEPLPRAVKIILILYVLINLTYSLGLKNVAIVEMLIVASGFMLRAYSGTIALNETPTHTFFFVIFFGALFIVASKRLAEYSNHEKKRKVLDNYTVISLTAIVIISVSMVIQSYAAFVLKESDSDLSTNSGFILIFSLLPFLTLMLLLLNKSLKGDLEKPESALRKDWLLISVASTWMVTVFIYSFIRN
jgi:decaprenyl-phosphate phosphoribosyltransferase